MEVVDEYIHTGAGKNDTRILVLFLVLVARQDRPSFSANGISILGSSVVDVYTEEVSIMPSCRFIVQIYRVDRAG